MAAGCWTLEAADCAIKPFTAFQSRNRASQRCASKHLCEPLLCDPPSTTHLATPHKRRKYPSADPVRSQPAMRMHCPATPPLLSSPPLTCRCLSALPHPSHLAAMQPCRLGAGKMVAAVAVSRGACAADQALPRKVRHSGYGWLAWRLGCMTRCSCMQQGATHASHLSARPRLPGLCST